MTGVLLSFALATAAFAGTGGDPTPEACTSIPATQAAFRPRKGQIVTDAPGGWPRKLVRRLPPDVTAVVKDNKRAFKRYPRDVQEALVHGELRREVLKAVLIEAIAVTAQEVARQAQADAGGGGSPTSRGGSRPAAGGGGAAPASVPTPVHRSPVVAAPVPVDGRRQLTGWRSAAFQYSAALSVSGASYRADWTLTPLPEVTAEPRSGTARGAVVREGDDIVLQGLASGRVDAVGNLSLRLTDPVECLNQQVVATR